MPDVFIMREFEINGRVSQCRFYRPEKAEVDYSCRYDIDWPSGTVSKVSYGVDEVQALILTMQRAHLDLLFGRSNHDYEVTWLEMNDLCLPIPENVIDWARDKKS